MEQSRKIDIATGIFFIFLGSAFAWGATSYRFGTSSQPGAAYFPFWLGILLGLIGVGLVLQTLLSKASRPRVETPIRLRPLLLTLVAVLLFALLSRTAGLVITVFVVVSLSALASDKSKIGPTMALAAGMAVFTWLVFSVGIGVPIPVLPPAFGF